MPRVAGLCAGERMENAVLHPIAVAHHATEMKVESITLTQLAALVAAVTPFVLAALAGWRAARNRAEDMEMLRWKRLQELAVILHNKGGDGKWSQLAAIAELGATSLRHREAALSILDSAETYWSREEGSADYVRAIRRAVTFVDRSATARLLGIRKKPLPLNTIELKG